MSKKERLENERKEYNKQHRINSQKVRNAGIFVESQKIYGNKTFGYEGRSYESHYEAVEDIVKRKGL